MTSPPLIPLGRLMGFILLGTGVLAAAAGWVLESSFAMVYRPLSVLGPFASAVGLAGIVFPGTLMLDPANMQKRPKVDDVLVTLKPFEKVIWAAAAVLGFVVGLRYHAYLRAR